MLNKLNELRKGKEEGFTLIELLVVIAIIGILAAIALPIFLNQQKEAAKASVKSDVHNTVTSIATLLVANPSADNTALSGAKVESAGNTVTVTGTGAEYSVAGVSASVSGWSYNFSSATGEYTTGTGA